MEINFAGKRALVTGAGKGIGRGVAQALANGGAETFALSRTQEDLVSLKAEVPDMRIICVDLEDWDATRQAVQEIGPIDLLVNNAGVSSATSFLDVSPEEFDRVISINLKSVLNVSQIVARGMVERKSGGSIVNVSSLCSSLALKGMTVYSSSKAGLDMMSKCMALELGQHQVRVNVVNPGFVKTAMAKHVLTDPARLKPFLDRTPLGRISEIEDVVNPILYLLSDKASMLNGVELPIDGGYIIQ